MKRLAQIEITTHCNLTCFYCVGRHVAQKHMLIETFLECLNQLQSQYVINLQGEGEPFLHPEFSRLVDLSRQAGHQLYTITNGTIKQPDEIIRKFRNLIVTIDTLDQDKAKQIGRGHIDKITANVLHWKTLIPVSIIIVGDHDNTVQSWARKNRIPVFFKPLETKTEYQTLYPDKRKPKTNPKGSLQCRYLESSLMRFFDIDGIELPCCYIKHTKNFPGQDKARELLNTGFIPTSCDGCLFLEKRP